MECHKGSILEPLLFTCYLKGLPDVAWDAKVCMYADDINLVIFCNTHQKVETLAQTQPSHIFVMQMDLLVKKMKLNLFPFDPSN